MFRNMAATLVSELKKKISCVNHHIYTNTTITRFFFYAGARYSVYYPDQIAMIFFPLRIPVSSIVHLPNPKVSVMLHHFFASPGKSEPVLSCTVSFKKSKKSTTVFILRYHTQLWRGLQKDYLNYMSILRKLTFTYLLHSYQFYYHIYLAHLYLVCLSKGQIGGSNGRGEGDLDWLQKWEIFYLILLHLCKIAS